MTSIHLSNFGFGSEMESEAARCVVRSVFEGGHAEGFRCTSAQGALPDPCTSKDTRLFDRVITGLEQRWGIVMPIALPLEIQG
jgi:hypothetical protein